MLQGEVLSLERSQRRVKREVQTVNWEAGKEGGCRDRRQERPEKGT